MAGRSPPPGEEGKGGEAPLPGEGRPLPVRLGSSFLEAEGGGGAAEHCLLNYRFKPASTDTTADGELVRVGEGPNTRVEVAFPDSRAAEGEETRFQGQLDDAQDTVVAIFEDGGVRLERVTASVQGLRPVRR